MSVDVNCIKKETQDEEEEVEAKWNAHNYQLIKIETENQQIKTEIDIGPIKLVENVYNNIKTESQELELTQNTEKAARETESRNPREVVRIFHQRIVQLDLNKAQKKQPPALSNAEHMRDLRQRLMNLETPIKPSSSKPAKTCSQMRRQLEERLIKIDMAHRNKRSKEPKQTAILPARNAPKSSAQRMRELRQRRREPQGTSSNVHTKQSHNQSTNTRPPTPPEQSVSRMREFRQRLLNLDESLQATNVKSRRSKISPSIRGRKVTKP